MSKIIYPELSYKIMGILFQISNQIGYGHREKLYQNAISKLFKDSSIDYKEQLKSEIKINNCTINKYFIDFIIEDKIILEIKAGERFNKENVAQVYDYLKANNLKLGILANFTKQGVKFKRIIYKY